MRLIIAISLLFVTLLVAGYSHASPAATECPNPETVTLTTYRPVFSNPHTGWYNMPVQENILYCPVR